LVCSRRFTRSKSAGEFEDEGGVELSIEGIIGRSELRRPRGRAFGSKNSTYCNIAGKEICEKRVEDDPIGENERGYPSFV